MKLLLDQGLPHSAVALLNKAGIDAAHVSEIGLASASDDEILATARDTESCVVTLDADFHAILARTHATSPSAIRIRIERLRAEALCKIIAMAIPMCIAELEQGAVATITIDRVRVRSLPLP